MLDEKSEISKSTLRKYLEKAVKGLKVASYKTFRSSKDGIKAKILSNVLSLLHAEELLKDVPRLPASSDDAGSEMSLKLLADIRNLLNAFNDSSKAKAAAKIAPKYLDKIETLAMQVGNEFIRLQKENAQLKASLDFLSQAGVAQPMTQSAVLSAPAPTTAPAVDSQMDQTAVLINKLQDDNVRLTKLNAEVTDRIKAYERNQGEKILMDQIKILEQQVREAKAASDHEKSDLKEQVLMLSLQIAEKPEQTSKDSSELKSAISAAEKKAQDAECSARDAKDRLAGKENEVRQLTLRLAQSIEQNGKLEEQVKAYAQYMSNKSSPTYFPAMVSAAPTTQVQTQGKKEETKKEEATSPASPAENNKLTYLTAMLAAKEDEVVKCMVELENFQKLYLNADREGKMAQMQIETVSKERDSLARRVMGQSGVPAAGTESEREKALQRELEEKAAKVKQLTEALAERDRAIKSNEERLVRYEVSNQSMESRLKDSAAGGAGQDSDLMKKLETAERARADCETKLKKSEEEVTLLRKMQEDATASHMMLQAELRNPAGPVTADVSPSAREKELVSARDSCSAMKKQLDSVGADNARLAAEVREKEGIIAHLKEGDKDRKMLEDLERALRERKEVAEQLGEAKQKLAALDEDNAKLKKQSDTTATVAKERVKHQEEINGLRLRVVELEKQIINIVASEKEKTEETARLRKEVERLNTTGKEKSEQLAIRVVEVDRMKGEKANLEKRIRELLEMAKDKVGGETIDYLKEIVYLYKTIINTAKERIEERIMKEERVSSISKILDCMSDPGINKEKLRSIVTSSIQQFPYLSKFDLKSDYKFIVMGMVKVIEHKQQKLATYKADRERNGIVLEYSEPKYKIYSDKLNALLSSR